MAIPNARVVVFLAAVTTPLAAQNFWQPLGSPGSLTIHALYADSGNVLYAGTSSGVYRSTNGGITWQASGLPNEDVLVLKRHRGALFAGTYIGGLYRSTNNGTTWTAASGLLGGVYALAELSLSFFAANDNGIFVSNNGGASWSLTTMNNPNQRAVTVSPTGHLYAGDVDGLVYRSTDAGATWTQILDASSTISDIVVTANGFMYVSLQSFFNPGVLRSTNNGVSWQNVLPSVVAGWFAVNSAGHVFVTTFSSYVYRTVDGGATWQQLSSGMASASTEGIAMNDSAIVFVGTRNGQVYRSAQPTVSVVEDGRLPHQFALYQNYPNPFSGRGGSTSGGNPSTRIKFQIPNLKSQAVSLKIYDVLGREVATLVDGEVTPGQHEVVWNAEGLASGVYFYRLRAGKDVETRRMVLLR